MHSLPDGISSKAASEQQGCVAHQGQAPWAEVDLFSQALAPAGSQAINVAPEVFTGCNLVLPGALENVDWQMTESSSCGQASQRVHRVLCMCAAGQVHKQLHERPPAVSCSLQEQMRMAGGHTAHWRGHPAKDKVGEAQMSCCRI